jgi:RNA polymerase sigma-70 factor (ECF subfamily)
MGSDGRSETVEPCDADEAMGRYSRGEDQAFAIVYDTVAPRLVGYLRRRVTDSARVEDIVQQTFLQMHAARGTFVDGAEVLPWAFTIARRVMVDLSRKSSRETPVDPGAKQETSAAFMSALASGEEVVMAQETHRLFNQALDRLTEPQRAAFELMKVEGLSLEQAASVLGTTVTGVKLRAHRAYESLREALLGDRKETALRGMPSSNPATM